MIPKFIFVDGAVQNDRQALVKEIKKRTDNKHFVYDYSVISKIADENKRINSEFKDVYIETFKDLEKLNYIILFIQYDEKCLANRFKNHLFVFERTALFQQLYEEALTMVNANIIRIPIYSKFNPSTAYDSYVEEIFY